MSSVTSSSADISIDRFWDSTKGKKGEKMYQKQRKNKTKKKAGEKK
jgi:hypothetical protein